MPMKRFRSRAAVDLDGGVVAITGAARVLDVLGPRTGDRVKLVAGFDSMVMDRDMKLDAQYERRVATERQR
jgi:hypothetical protein